MSRTRRVHLHGIFATYHDGYVTIEADTAAEAIEGITRQLPGFAPHPVYGRQRLKAVGCNAVEDYYRDLGDQEELHLVPQFNGGKNSSSTMQIILGAVLVAASFIPGLNAAVASFIFKAGAMAILGGVAQLLAPAPEIDTADESLRSRYLGAPKNTVKIGTRIPVLYGEARAYGHYLSFDINARQGLVSSS